MPRGAARVGALALAALATATLGACGSAGDAAHPAATRTPAPVVLATTAPLPKHVVNQPDARKDVSVTGCSAVRGGWAASGTVTNSQAKAATYTITVYFTTTHATTLDFATAKVRVPAGLTRTWTASKQFAAQSQMLCPVPGIARVS